MERAVVAPAAALCITQHRRGDAGGSSRSRGGGVHRPAHAPRGKQSHGSHRLRRSLRARPARCDSAGGRLLPVLGVGLRRLRGVFAAFATPRPGLAGRHCLRRPARPATVGRWGVRLVPSAIPPSGADVRSTTRTHRRRTSAAEALRRWRTPGRAKIPRLRPPGRRPGHHHINPVGRPERGHAIEQGKPVGHRVQVAVRRRRVGLLTLATRIAVVGAQRRRTRQRAMTPHG